MTLERAIEILNPDGDWRGNGIDNLEEVQEACRVACAVVRDEVKRRNAAQRKEVAT